MSVFARDTFVTSLGAAGWNDSWDYLSKIDPEIFQASVNLMAVPRKKNHLSTKMQSLVLLSVDCAATHLYERGIRQHIKAAAAAGASRAEVLEVLELSSTLGIHACNIGIPILVQVMKEEGLYDSHPMASKPFDQRRLDLKASFTSQRGYWHGFWEGTIHAHTPESHTDRGCIDARFSCSGSRILRVVHRVLVRPVDTHCGGCDRAQRSSVKYGRSDHISMHSFEALTLRLGQGTNILRI